tara:strand:- start:115985 stop:117304 length:1320 start_codon:yes stop_codon:yes gene_type:complete
MLLWSPAVMAMGPVCKSLFYVPQRVGIVDAYSSGRHVAPALNKYGIETVHVQSEKEIADPYFASTFDPSNFKTNVINSIGDIVGLVRRLIREKVELIIPGAESGVLLADELAHGVGTRGNPIETSSARRNKFDMSERLRSLGIDSVKQIKSDNWERTRIWIENHGKWPIVLKPVQGMGGNGNHVANNMKEAERAFKKLIGFRDSEGRILTEVLVQEFLGNLTYDSEYVVNTVSFMGIHVVTDVWRYHKYKVEGEGVIYSWDELLPSRGELQEKLIAYNHKVLDALEFRNGASHMEIMMTERGPILIENNARLSGASGARLTELTIGKSAVDWLVESIVGTAGFINRAKHRYKLKKEGLIVFIRTPEPGTMDSKLFDKVKSLSSFAEWVPYHKDGERVEKTVDSDTLVAEILLTNKDQEQLHRDLAQILKIQEEKGFLQY